MGGVLGGPRNGGSTDAACSLLLSTAQQGIGAAPPSAHSSPPIYWCGTSLLLRRRMGALSVIKICKHYKAEVSILRVVQRSSVKVLPLKYELCGFSSTVTWKIMLLCGMNYLTELCASLNFYRRCYSTKRHKVWTDSSCSKAWGNIFE